MVSAAKMNREIRTDETGNSDDEYLFHSGSPTGHCEERSDEESSKLSEVTPDKEFYRILGCLMSNLFD